MKIIEVEIKNWVKHNPRSDVKSCAWFRMDNDFFNDPGFYDLDGNDRLVWIFILCVASKKMSPKVKINTQMVADSLKVTSTAVLNSITNLVGTESLLCDTTNVITTRSDTIVSLKKPSATNERTDERTYCSDRVNPAPVGFFSLENPDIDEVKISDKASTALTMLNALCFKNFRPVGGNIKYVNARIKEGYSLEDFKKVIIFKQNQWGVDPKMIAYLRPKTIFGPNFDSYLQEVDSIAINSEDALLAEAKKLFSFEESQNVL